MQPQHDGSPSLRVVVHQLDEATESDPATLSDHSADLPLLGGGRLRLTRGQPEAHYFLAQRPSDEDLLHPYVAPAAAVMWQWAGREAIHAGAFQAGAGAVLVLGDKEAGKSTTLGWLATHGGVNVLTDDLAVLDGTQVLAGPRSIDLRPTAETTGQTLPLVRDGERHRLRLPAVDAALPLCGVVLLEWGPKIELAPVRFPERLPLISRQRTFPSLTPNAVTMLELGSAPTIWARRPQGLSGLAAFGPALVDYFS
jgi:hypothetical protein